MDERKIEAILKHYSPESQTVKAIEELAELQVELARLLLDRGNRKNMISELADVFIMMVQIGAIYDVDPEELDDVVRYKLDRQLERIEEEAE